MYFIFCMLCIRSLCSNLRDSSVFSCGSTDVACVLHSCSRSVLWSWKFASMLLRWAPPSFFIRNSVRVVGPDTILVLNSLYVLYSSVFG